MKRYFEFVQADFEAIKSFHLKDELNPKLWDGFDLDDEVREQLLTIGQDFFDNVDIPTRVVDIALCGSLCNYNWSEKYSDFDLHIVIDFSKINANYEIVEKLCDYAKKVWNEQHDITIKGYEVEIAIQDSYDLKKAIDGGRMGGVFSLMKNKWIKRPEKADFEPDESLIKEKAKTIMMSIDDIESQFDEDKNSAIIDKVDKVWKKIKSSRQSGLDSESGEYSTGNLVFKLLRRNGYVSKVMKLKRNAYDKQFESSQNDDILRLLYLIDELDVKLSSESSEGWCMSISCDYDESKDYIDISYSAHGYSEGFSDDLRVYYKELPIKVERQNYGSTVEGSFDNNETDYFDSFDELINNIKEEFGK